MSTTNGSPGAGSFAIEKAVVFAAGIAAAIVAIVHGTAWVIAFTTRNTTPPLSAPRALGMLRGHPYAPHVPLIAHVIVIVIALLLVALAIRQFLRIRDSRRHAPAARAVAFDARQGWATRAAVSRAASAKTVTAQAATLRPGVDRARVDDIGYLLGTAHGQPVWASCERSGVDPI